MAFRFSRLFALAAVFAVLQPALGQSGGKFKTYRTKYYVLHTDLVAESVKEATQRIERMAEMYHKRTRSFAGTIKSRLSFYLFSDPRDYYRAGGLRGSGGMFDGEKLMAIAGPKPSAQTWQLVQHEGFHQFAFAVIRGVFPAWVNEGMAEYFGDSVYTGDGFVTGVIPAQRLKRLKLWIDSGHVISIDDMMQMPHSAWNANLSVINYDQAWSMIYFLAHAENGRYQRELNGYIKACSRGTDPDSAWSQNFGTGTRAFERKWLAYWKGLTANPTAGKYAEATVAKLTSFYARAFSQRQIYQNMAEFVGAAQAGRLKAHEDDWLPNGLLQEALREMRELGNWEIRRRPGRYEVVCKRNDGTEIVGTFKVRSRRVKDVDVETRQSR